jgi:transcriptional regulator with XRE-family HTH domain
MLQEHYPNRLCFLRKRRRTSQKRLAVLAGIKNRSLVSHYERGRVDPNFESAWKFAYILDVTPADIFPRLVSRWQQEVEAARSKLPRPLTAQEFHDPNS